MNKKIRGELKMIDLQYIKDKNGEMVKLIDKTIFTMGKEIDECILLDYVNLIVEKTNI